MPNFWTSTTQKIAEAFNGPRTRDVEFDQKVDDMKVVEKSIIGLKTIFQNFVNYTSGIKSFSRDFYNSNRIIFDKSSSYGALGNDICECHSQMEKSYEEFLISVNELNLATSQWSTMFTQAKKKEESRKVYDHYDEKMEKIYKSRQEKVKKNGSETPKEYELILRNEQKYKKATEEYIGLSVTAYDFMSDALDSRYEIINPIVGKFIEYENKFYQTVFNSFRTLENMDYKFKTAAKKYVKSENTYDPTKYIRGGDLIKHNDNEKEQPKAEIKPRSRSFIPDRNQQSMNTVKKKEISDFDQIENQFSNIDRKPNSNGKQIVNKQHYEEHDQTEANDNINNPYAQINLNSNINFSQNKYQQQPFNKRSSTPNQIPVNDNFDFNQFNKVNNSNTNNNNFNNSNNFNNNSNSSSNNNFDLLNKNTNTNNNKNNSNTSNFNYNNNANSSFNQGFANNNHNNNNQNNNNHNNNNQNNFDFGLMDLTNPNANNIQKNINTVNSGLTFYQNNQSQINNAAKNANNMNNSLINSGITTGIPSYNPNQSNTAKQNNNKKSDNDIFQDFFK